MIINERGRNKVGDKQDASNGEGKSRVKLLVHNDMGNRKKMRFHQE